MKNIIFFYTLFVITAVTACAQTNVTDGYKKTTKGLWYKIFTDARKPKAQLGDIMKLNIVYSTQHDSVLFSTYNEGQGPAQFTCMPPNFNGDPMEGFTMLGEGDSAIFLMPEDSAYKNQQPPPFAKKGEYIKIKVSVLSVMTKEQYDKQKAEESKMQTEQEAKTIEDYLAKNNLHAQKTPSGLYYIVEKQGDGKKVTLGDTVSVDYTGKLLDGTEFDSSHKPGRTPYTFKLGTNPVIQGWVEGLQLFNVGGKGLLLIPSPLGYGTRGNGRIPPNSILIFNVELMK
ncbi:MAG TPA: FKBP-type peptidyl-prolyl cis-trans isomerase [Chitinophagales bacterium]|nr:FKBP-type peptidyl-prolyl cis-trans isomerase [Chitinophagales bacterium]